MLRSGKKRERSGIQRGPRREWPAHVAWIKTLRCCIPDCYNRNIDPAHLRTAANSGTGLKPPDWYLTPLCHSHHIEAHQYGHDTLAETHGIDLFAIAADLAARSPDTAMKEEMERWTPSS